MFRYPIIAIQIVLQLLNSVSFCTTQTLLAILHMIKDDREKTIGIY